MKTIITQTTYVYPDVSENFKKEVSKLLRLCLKDYRIESKDDDLKHFEKIFLSNLNYIVSNNFVEKKKFKPTHCCGASRYIANVTWKCEKCGKSVVYWRDGRKHK